MATSSYAKSLLKGLSGDIKSGFNNVLDYVFTNTFAFGPIDADAAQSKTENFAGRYVKVTTSATANQEVAVAHGLGKVPNVIWQVTSPRVVGSRFLGDLEVSRAADEMRVYLKSSVTSATVWLFLE
jgi:hypothetical protein